MSQVSCTKDVARFEGKGQVVLRVGGHGQECIGKTYPARTKAGHVKFVVLDAVIEDYGPGDVVTFRCHFA